MRRARLFLAALALAALPAPADTGSFAPPPALQVEGVPSIAPELREALRPYGEFRPHALLSWHPTKREMLVRRRHGFTNQVHRVAEPGAGPISLTDFPDAIFSAEYQPVHARYFLFLKARGGDEVYRIHRYDFETRAVTPIGPEGERAGSVTFNRRGDRIAYTTFLIDRNNPERTARTTLRLMDPSNPKGERVLARFESGGWFGLRFSEDGRRLAFMERISSNESHLWVLDLADGRKRRVTRPGRGEPVRYDSPRFSKDGRGLFATSNRGSEYRRLVYIPLAGGEERVLTGHLAHDVDDFEPGFEAGRIAFTTNEDGSSVLRFIDLASWKEQPRPALFHGVLGGLEWRRNSTEVGFHVESARTAGDVFSYDVKTHRLARWTNGNNPEVNTSELAEPRIVHWKSFDGRMISGLHYHPGPRFSGKRPVLVNIHGSPASQARPGFKGRYNYFVSELGIAMIEPNVRGSLGFGKTFLRLDDGRLREDSVKDIGALLDWIRGEPDLDADRVMVLGGSYGGYMAFASAVHFADRIAGAMSIVGISNFVTFLERTESYRRDLRRAEYGDERDPAMRAFLESIAPLNHADRITKPLLVAQGRNDPRVPYTEAEQIVRSLQRRGHSVWFLMAEDEGHGFVKKPNADFLFCAMVEFAKRVLPAAPP